MFDIESQNPDYWNKKGAENYKLNKYDEAIQCFYKSIQLNPNFEKPWYNLSIVLRKLGKFEDSKYCLDRFKEIESLSKDNISDITIPASIKKVVKIGIMGLMIIFAVIFSFTFIGFFESTLQDVNFHTSEQTLVSVSSPVITPTKIISLTNRTTVIPTRTKTNESTQNVIVPKPTITTIAANYGTLKITTDPTDAEIYIDNNYVGLSPVEKNLIIGQHNIKIHKKGKEDFFGTVDIQSGRTKQYIPEHIGCDPRDTKRCNKNKFYFAIIG